MGAAQLPLTYLACKTPHALKPYMAAYSLVSYWSATYTSQSPREGQLARIYN